MKRIITICLIFSSLVTSAQIGGSNTYEFLNVPISARFAGLGGGVVAVKDNDPTLAINNPSLLNSEMNSMTSFSYLNYFSDINHGFFSFVKDFKKTGTFSLGIRYLNYGTFTEADEGGRELGEFSAAEYAFILGWGKQIDSNFSVGANLKPIYSNLYLHSSSGIALDLSATYDNKDIGLAMSLLVKNIGTQFTPYVEGGDREPLPFEIQYGISYKLGHSPIRIYSDITHLQNWNLSYNDSILATNSNSLLSEEEKSELNRTNLFTEYLAHQVIGVEFLPSKSFMLRLGYSPRRRNELAHDNKPGLIGFSWGIGFRIKKFHVSYGSAKYHLAGPSNHFTITTNLSEHYKKNSPRPAKKKKVKKSKNKENG